MSQEPKAECNVWFDGRYLQLKINGELIPCKNIKLEQTLDDRAMICVEFLPTKLIMGE